MDKTLQISKAKKVCIRKISKQKILRIFLAIAILTIIGLIVIKPELCINSVHSGLVIWSTSVLPSLLPFMFFTKILTDLDFVTGLAKKFKNLTKFLFNAPSISTYIFFISSISGYPVGAKLISEFYQAGLLTEKQANKLTTFCSTSGPLFIIGSVGTAMFANKTLGYIMFFSHILSSIVNGILYRNLYKDDYEANLPTKSTNLSEILPNSMTSSITSCLIVGGYIAIFFLIIDLANNLNLFTPFNYIIKFILSPFGIDSATSNSIVSGIFEISKGCNMLSQLNLPIIAVGTIASFLISFGGLSVFFQAITFLSKCKVNLGFYLLQKFTHGLISAVITFVLCLMIL